MQGNNAQFGLGSLKSAATCWLGWCNEDGSASSEEVAPVENVAAKAAPADRAAEVVAKAAKTVKKASASAAVIISNMPGLSVLSAKPEAFIKAALDTKSKTDDVLALGENLSLKEHLELVKTVKSAVTEQAQGVSRRITVLTKNTAAKTGCAEKKVKEAEELAAAIDELPTRAAAITKEGIVANKKCQGAAAGLLQKRCIASDLAPIAFKEGELVKDTHQYTVEAMNTVKSLRAEFAVCTKKARAQRKK